MTREELLEEIRGSIRAHVFPLARKTRKTLRRMSPLSKELAKQGNEAYKLAARLMTLSEKVAHTEHMAEAAENAMVTFEQIAEEA